MFVQNNALLSFPIKDMFIITGQNKTASFSTKSCPGNRIAAAFLFAWIVFCLAGCTPFQSGNSKPVQRELFAMDTYMTLSAYGKNAETALEHCENEIRRLDKLLNAEDPESEISQINSAGEGVLSEDCSFIVAKALELYEKTEGAFDISILPLVRLWGFPEDRLHLPTEEELKETLALVGSDRISFNPQSGKIRFLKEGMGIDAGGIGKGYASERAAGLIREEGITSALLNLGGNVYAVGTKPDGSRWKIAIQDPKKDGAYLGILEVEDACVITSGPYERYFENDGKRYHHILNPSDGYPADSGLLSVSVISDDATEADGLSTALFVMGKDQAYRYWQSHRDEFQMVLMDESEEVFVTEGIADHFRTEYNVQVLS